jgi:hypothetical protein
LRERNLQNAAVAYEENLRAMAADLVIDEARLAARRKLADVNSLRDRQ